MKRLFGCKTDRSINFLSIISLSTILVERTINKNCAYCIGGVVCAMTMLCIIATFNNPDLNLIKEELNYLKKCSSIINLITGGFVILFILIFPNKKIVSYLALGVI